MVKENNSVALHTELRRPRIQKDGQAVSAVVDLIQGWANPFSEKRELMSISTAKAAPRDIAADQKNACEIGEKCYAAFKEERMEKTPQ
jgi:hypothetical protein